MASQEVMLNKTLDHLRRVEENLRHVIGRVSPLVVPDDVPYLPLSEHVERATAEFPDPYVGRAYMAVWLAIYDISENARVELEAMKK